MPRIHRPSRLRRFAKWSGLVVCLLIGGLWAISTVLCIFKIVMHADGIGLAPGVFRFVWFDGISLDMPWGVWWHAFDAGSLWPAFDYEPRFDNFVSVSVPLWMLLTFVAIPTFMVWHRDRRVVKPGHCEGCGYDLRASKKTCPECGTAIAPERR